MWLLAMAIYHFSAKVISRSCGSSALASAAYRSASRLRDERLDRTHDFSNKSGVVHSEVMLPEGAPEHLSDRQTLWNEVEAVEKRKDAQLSREIEFAIPRELTREQGIELARDFVATEFVDRGMCADLNVHWDIGADGLAKPHAHVMLTMREVNEEGFGQKVRDWNKTELIEHWRERWAGHVNERLAELDIDARIDHRSLEAQGIDLEPQTKIGAPAQRMGREGLDADRLVEHHEIARDNGERIIANPQIALDAITHQQSTFTRRDLAMFVHRHSDGLDQFNEVMGAVQSSPELVALGTDGRGQERFTSREMIAVEDRLHRASEVLASRKVHAIDAAHRVAPPDFVATRGLVLSSEQRGALSHITEGRDLSVVVGYAGTGKSAMLGVAREAWEEAGMSVRGVALSGIAAENLEIGSGIASRTIASMEHGWSQGRDLLTSSDVLVIDEAGMVGTRQMERVLSHARDEGAKVILVGDPQQLQAIEAGAAFRSIAERHGAAEITDIRRQQEGWQREATRQLATGRTGEALDAYRSHDMVHAAPSREAARGELVDGWNRERLAEPKKTRLILAHTNDDVRALNEAARGKLRDANGLGFDVTIEAERGTRRFASGDRLMFLKNDRDLGVKNGTLGTVEQVSNRNLAVRLDDGRSVVFAVRDYNQIDHGYAATIHKSQGVTVDRTHVLATPGMDQHSAYVAMSRHREEVQVHYGRDDFADDGRLARTLSRERGKDMASDYARDNDPARGFAERRGIRFRERVAEIVRKVVPERVRDLFDGLREERAERQVDRSSTMPGRESDASPANAPQRGPAAEAPDPEAAQRRIRTNALREHARAMDAIYTSWEQGYDPSPDQIDALQTARSRFDEVRPFGWRDAEAAYKKDHSLAAEGASGPSQRAVRALQLETELRTDPARRADKFVEDWQKLTRESELSYKRGKMSAYSAARTEMGNMARSLERDPQMESLLAARKTHLGIGIDSGRSLGRALAFSQGIDFELGRGLGI